MVVVRGGSHLPACQMNRLQPLLVKYEILFRRALLLTAIYGLAVWFTMRPNVVADPDLGWHFRTGQWILANGAVPTTDPFSSYGQGKAWVAYSWLFEIMIYGFYRAFGLAGVVIYTVTLCLGILLALQSLLRRLGASAARTVGLMGLAVVAFAPILTPRPWLFTILFATLELNLLLTAQRTGNLRPLRWLVPLFVLWANLHIQFVYGFILLGLYLIAPFVKQLCAPPFALKKLKNSFHPQQWLLFISCVAATLINPYHFKLYLPVIEIVQKTGAFEYVLELQAMNFRNLTHWVVLAVTLGATFVLGWQRKAPPFLTLLLLAATFLAFRASRDVWLVVITALSILATAPTPEANRIPFAIPSSQALVVVVLLGLFMVFTAKKRDFSAVGLDTELAKSYPVAATQFVEKQGYPGPLYNHFDWGGYLIWRLPRLPVSMDGRTNLHGDPRIQRSVKTWLGAAQWAEDTELAAARLVIAEVKMPLVSLLKCDSRFELVYQDAVTAVFIARTPPAATK
jgi:hypothetical protein